MADEIIHVFERKLDGINWILYPILFGILILNYSNYLAKTPQAESQLFNNGLTQAMAFILWTTLYCIPRTKKHTAKVVIFC